MEMLAGGMLSLIYVFIMMLGALSAMAFIWGISSAKW